MVTTMVAYTHPRSDWPTMFGKYVAPKYATLKELQVGPSCRCSAGRSTLCGVLCAVRCIHYVARVRGAHRAHAGVGLWGRSTASEVGCAPARSLQPAATCACVWRERTVLSGRSQPSAAKGSVGTHAHAHGPCACAVLTCGRAGAMWPLQNPAKGSIPQLLADMPNIYQTMLENWMRADTSVSLV